MKRIIRYFILTAAIFIAGTCSFAQLFGKNAVPHVNNPLPFSKGVNITTWLESYEPCDSGLTYFGKQDLINLKNMGADVVRIPIHFDHWVIPDSNYTLSPLLLETMDDIAKWAQEIQLYVIFDNHTSENKPLTPNVEKFLSRIWSQVSLRYRKEGKYIIYEILNEPSGLTDEQWGEIQGRIIKLIRGNDATHSIIINGANQNSVESMCKLPQYEEANLIYSFHDFDPYLFTYQRLSWGRVPHAVRIPFPYNEEQPLVFPENGNLLEKNFYNSYPHDSSEYTMTDTLDKAIAFVNARHSSLLCTAYGANNIYVDTRFRTAWYKTVSGYMNQRGISHIAWSFTGDFGFFKFGSSNIFPRDIDSQMIKAIGLEIPTYKITSWLDDAKKSGDYSLYNTRFAQKVKVKLTLPNNGKDCNLFKRDPNNGESCIYFPKLQRFNELKLYFSKPCDFTPLYAKNAKLQFTAKTQEQNLKLQIWFENSGYSDYYWRCTATINNKQVPSDGAWHTVTIPFSDFIDNGAFEYEKRYWVPSQGKFLWNDVASIHFQSDYDVYRGLSIKDIKLIVE